MQGFLLALASLCSVLSKSLLQTPNVRLTARLELPAQVKEGVGDAASWLWDLGHRREDLPVCWCLTQKALLEMTHIPEGARFG